MTPASRTELPESLLLRRLLASTPAGIIVRDAAGQTVLVNERAGEVLGLTSAQLFLTEPPPPGWSALRDDGGPRGPTRCGRASRSTG